MVPSHENDARIVQLRPSQQRLAVANFGDDGHLPPMNERIGKLEGQQEGLKQSQLIMLVAVTTVSAILIGLILWVISEQKDLSKQLDTRINALSEKVEALPDKINNQLRDLTQAFSTAITASKQQTPQVILMPAPQLPAPEKLVQPPTPPK